MRTLLGEDGGLAFSNKLLLQEVHVRGRSTDSKTTLKLEDKILLRSCLGLLLDLKVDLGHEGADLRKLRVVGVT